VALVHPKTVWCCTNVVWQCVVIVHLVVEVGDVLEAFETNEMALVRLVDIAALSEKTCPELNSNDAKDEEDKEAKEEDITQHGQGVQ
jgi:hypothetical protein